MGDSLVFIPGCREIVKHGYNGYLFTPRSTVELIEKLIQFIKLDKEQKKFMGENSRRKVEIEFDRQIVVEEYIKIIQKLLK